VEHLQDTDETHEFFSSDAEVYVCLDSFFWRVAVTS